MNPETRKPVISRFDLTVWGTSIALLLATALISVMAQTKADRIYVAYLSPAYGGLQNIWIAPLDNPEEAEQVTFSEGGIFNFGVSNDGRSIAYADRDVDTGLTDLFLLNLQTRKITKLTNCIQQSDDCKTPIFHPDDNLIAYERMNISGGVQGAGPGAIRIWLLDLTTSDYATQRLFEDSQVIGHSPQWSKDGSRIAFYNSDIASPGVIVYDFGEGDEQNRIKLIPSNFGDVGSLSPNGNLLVFPEPIRRENQVYTFLKIADLAESAFIDLTPAEDPIDDIAAEWHPSGESIVIARRYTDDRWTPGYQLYLLDMESGESRELVYDERYSHGFFAWDDAGEWLLMQRFPLLGEDGEPNTEARPEVWAYHLETGELRLIAKNVFLPRWINP